MKIIIAFLMLQTSLIICGSALSQPDLSQQHPYGAQYLTVNAHKLWALGFEGQGQAVVIAEGGNGVRIPRLSSEGEANVGAGTIYPGFLNRVIIDLQCDNPNDPAQYGCFNDASGHAFATTRIAAWREDNAISDLQGIARSAFIININLSETIDNSGFGLFSDILNIVRNAHVPGIAPFEVASVNLSVNLSSYNFLCENQTVIDQVKELTLAGVAIISPAIRADGPEQAFPACIEGVISVGSISVDDNTGTEYITNLTKFNTALDLLAPSTQAGSLSATIPHVTGAFAVLKQAKPKCSVSEILLALKNTGKPINQQRTDTGDLISRSFSKPLIDIEAAYYALDCRPPADVITSISSNGNVIITPVQ